MSTAPAAHAAPSVAGEKEIRIISHSNLFYWWPVWAIGFIMALLTYIDGHRMTIVPRDTKVVPEASFTARVEGAAEKTVFEKQTALVLPPNKTLTAEEGLKKHAAESKNYGVIFATVLLLCIAITNVPLRGMWSVVIIMLIIMLVIIFSLAGWWDPILSTLSLLQIYINAGGYLFISLILFGIWLVTFLFFDQQIYMIFTPRQLKVRTEIGGGEVTYDTIGMSLQKQRSDLFRHWILGLGSGDLIVNTAGAQVHHFDLPNVLFVGKKVQQIEDMMREIPQASGH
jgi:hypothetical protein